MRLRITIISTAALLMAALPGAAQPKDLPGSKDPAVLTRMPGYIITEFREQQFDAHEFVIQKGNDTAKQHVEGHWTQWRYDFNPSAGTTPSMLQVQGNFQNAVLELGGKLM